MSGILFSVWAVVILLSTSVRCLDVTLTFYDDFECNGNVQSGPLHWSEQKRIYNVPPSSKGDGATLVNIECGNGADGEQVSCSFALYGNKRRERESSRGAPRAGCETELRSFIESAGLFTYMATEALPRRTEQETVDPFQDSFTYVGDEESGRLLLRWTGAREPIRVSTLQIADAIDRLDLRVEFSELRDNNVYYTATEVHPNVYAQATHRLRREFTTVDEQASDNQRFWWSLLTNASFLELYLNDPRYLHPRYITLLLFGLGGEALASAAYVVDPIRPFR